MFLRAPRLSQPGRVAASLLPEGSDMAGARLGDDHRRLLQARFGRPRSAVA
jgi:hypothetical protein